MLYLLTKVNKEHSWLKLHTGYNKNFVSRLNFYFKSLCIPQSNVVFLA